MHAVLILGLLAAQPTMTGVQVAPNPSSQFELADLRPPKDRKTKRLSSMILDCNFNVFSVGDEGYGKLKVGANRLPKLEAYLMQRFGASLAGHRLEVTDYWLAINGAAGGKEYALKSALGGGVLAPALADGATRRPKCSREKMKAGWFESSEITNNFTPLVVDFKARLDGDAILVRTVKSPSRDLSSGMFWIEYSSEDQKQFDAVVDESMRKIGDEIQARLRN
jgi:hypothetical protein